MFATNARYKREAYRGSEFAPRILAQQGIQVVMKVSIRFLSRHSQTHGSAEQSDHPVLDSRYLLYEAQQAYLYGLPENLAIAAVTRYAQQDQHDAENGETDVTATYSTPATIMGMDHRIGYIKEGWDAGEKRCPHCLRMAWTHTCEQIWSFGTATLWLSVLRPPKCSSTVSPSLILHSSSISR